MKNRVLLALAGCSIVFCCAVFALAQDPKPESTENSFELAGSVTSKTDQQLEVRLRDRSSVSINVDSSTDFAVRLTNPWFDAKGRKVVVDGGLDENGERERIKYALPDGKLYLLAQFRTTYHRDRILKTSPWRITNYLIGSDPIEANLPKDDDLFLVGEVDLENSALIINGKSWPIVLGYRGATLRNRSFKDIVAGKTDVLVSGTKSGDTKTATTILFLNR